MRKRLVFTAAMLLIPVAFFAAAEGALRVFGFGATYPLFVPVEGRAEYLYQNRDVARRYFTHIENVPSSLTDFFEAEKDTSTFRIFVQGGSSGAGFPFYYGGSFSRMLEQRLLQTFPERHIEVVNTSMAAVNSYTLLDFADEILAQKPDAVLIYAGHNEYYGALGVGSSESIGGRPRLIRTYLALSDIRIVQALRRILGWTMQKVAGRDHGEAPSGTLMSRMVGKQSIAYGSPEYERGLHQFRSNLSRLLKTYAAHGVPVFVGTLASNERDHEPFVAGFSPGARRSDWETHYAEAIRAAAKGDTTAALTEIDRAISADSLHADAHFAKGRLLEGSGRYEEARSAYVAAKDRDELRFRAPEDINAIIREEADRFDAFIVDTREALAAASKNHIIGSDVMTEHLHPNVDGYFEIADAFYESMRDAKLIGSWTQLVDRDEARRQVLLTEVDSLVGIFRIRQLMAGWPFQSPGVTKPWMDDVDTSGVVTRIALALYRGDTNWAEANAAARRYYEQQHDYHAALRAALAQIQEVPFAAEPYLVAGNVLMRQGRYDEAFTYFYAGNQQEETALGHRMLGSVLLHRGNRDRAVNHLERAVELDPTDRVTLYNLSGAYALDGEYEDARQTVSKLLSLDPDHRDGRRLLASLPTNK